MDEMVIFNEKRFTVEHYMMIQYLIDESIERLDDLAVERLQQVRSIVMSQLYKDDKDTELDNAISEYRLGKANRRMDELRKLKSELDED